MTSLRTIDTTLGLEDFLDWQAVERGELLLGGAAEDPLCAILLFQAESEEVPAAFATADPYVLNGLLRKWSVRTWHTVVGRNAARPIHST